MFVGPLLRGPLRWSAIQVEAHRALVVRLALVDAAAGGGLVARLHLSWFCVGLDDLTYFLALVGAMAVVGALAYLAIREPMGLTAVVGRTFGASLFVFPAWALCMAVVGAVTGAQQVTLGPPSLGGAVSIVFVGGVVASVLALPVAVPFAVLHGRALHRLRARLSRPSLQPLVDGRALGARAAAIVAGLMLLERSCVATSHPWSWTLAPVAVLLAIVAVDGLLILRDEHRARRLLREVLRGDHPQLSTDSDGTSREPHDVVPLGWADAHFTIVEGAPGRHRAPAVHRVFAVLPVALAEPTGRAVS